MYHSSKEYKRAKRKVENKKGFYGHLSAYLAMSIFLLLVNLLTFHGDIWFFYPMIGWGIAVVIHYFSVFGFPFIGALDEDWEEREIQKELKRKKRYFREADEDDELELKPLKRLHNKDWDDRDLV